MKLTNHVIYWRFAKALIEGDPDIISQDIGMQRRRAINDGLFVTNIQKIKFYEQDQDNIVRNLITGVIHCNAYYLPRFLSQHKIKQWQKLLNKRKPAIVTSRRQRSPNRRRN